MRAGKTTFRKISLKDSIITQKKVVVGGEREMEGREFAGKIRST
jgi:hypothetical protein